MNIWTSENIIKYWDGTSATAKGEWVKRNGENAISIQPNNFHQNNASIQIFKEEFLPNTQYVINLYIDTDDVVYNGNNVAGGVSVVYTDGTSVNLAPVGNKASPKGWQQKFLITDASKSVSYMTSYYYTSIPVYYRWDSYIIPYVEAGINKEGILTFGTLNNIQSETAAIQKGGTIYAENFYEF